MCNEKDKAYYVNLINMTYSDAINSLIEKYGPVEKDYHKRNKDKKIGLHIHHIAELTVPNLSNKDNVKTLVELQKKEHLVYCDIMEHFIIHYLINIYNKNNYQYNDANDDKKYNSIKLLNKADKDNPKYCPNGMNSLLGKVNKFYIEEKTEELNDAEREKITIDSDASAEIVDIIRNNLSEKLDHKYVK